MVSGFLMEKCIHAALLLLAGTTRRGRTRETGPQLSPRGKFDGKS